jgi:hypothetical protein
MSLGVLGGLGGLGVIITHPPVQNGNGVTIPRVGYRRGVYSISQMNINSQLTNWYLQIVNDFWFFALHY